MVALLEQMLLAPDEPHPAHIWDEVHLGLRSRFPRAYWEGTHGDARAFLVCQAWLRHEQILTADQAAQITRKHFMRAKLYGMLTQVYKHSPYAALQPHFPDLQPWQMLRSPRELWQGAQGYTNALQALAWLLERHQLSARAAAQQLSLADIYDAGLRGMLKYVFDDRIERLRATLHLLAQHHQASQEKATEPWQAQAEAQR